MASTTGESAARVDASWPLRLPGKRPVTGLAILRAIVAGERRGDVLARLRQPGCRHTEQDIIAALTGTWRAEHLFVLAQSLDLYDFYTTKITECDRRAALRPTNMRRGRDFGK